jgi:uncharacterized protein YyaL (SSP411 family)
LKEADESGITPIEALSAGRKDLRLLVIALANFISNQLMSENALVQPMYYLSQMQRSNTPNYSIEDQAYAIRALLAAWELTQLDTYLYSAQEIYFSMNRNAFSVEDSFYINGDGSTLTFPQRVHILRALMDLQSHLPQASQSQLARISEPWLNALEALQ